MMSVSKFLFFFFDILESKVFTEGFFGISFLSLHKSENAWNGQKTPYFHIFWGIKMLYIINQIIYDQILL